MSKQSEKLYLQDIFNAINQIEEYQRGMTLDTFINDKKTIDAIVRNLEIIGEAANNIPQEFKTSNPTIPWREMISMRNKVLHEYFGVDLEILWKTTHEDLPQLKQELEKLPKAS